MAMQDMVKCIETEDVFFDSVDHLSAEHDSVVNGVLGYDFWRNEPRSIKERRETFLHKMGFVDHSCSSSDKDDGPVDDDDVLDRGLAEMGNTSADVSSSCSSSSIDCEAGNEVYCDNESEDDHSSRQNVDVCEHDKPSTSKMYKSVNKKIRHWWKEMMKRKKGNIGECICNEDNSKFEMNRTKVRVNKKKFKELSAMFAAQEIQAHKGIIWTMKFSPDGQYLATGGEDGVVRVWLVKSVDSCRESFADESSSEENTGFLTQKTMKTPVTVIPDKMFNIEETPVHEFYGHAADVLDLAWSNSNLILSSSMDKTVRLWQLGSDTCLNTFHHTDYVTCVQFNPVDNRYFISGSIDGKVRIWGVEKRRVLDWADIRDAVTAVCYQPDEQGFVVGSLSGSCQFYEAKGDLFELSAQILLQSSKRSSTNRITGIQFCQEDPQRVMIMSEDSKLRIVDKTDVLCKFRGVPKSGSQMSASFTSNGKHIISVGQDSHIYLWNHEKPLQSSSRHSKSIRSYEHFYSEGVSVAVPWSGTETWPQVPGSWSTEHEAACTPRDPSQFSLSNLFSSKSSAIWPEDMLPVLAQPEVDHQGRNNVADYPTWGLVIVTASWDGMIKTFHNYGLPIKV